MGRRTLLLIASILIAAVGTALIGLYVRGADTRAQQNQSTVQVLVSTKTIAAGATLDKALLSVRPSRVTSLMAENGFTGAGARTQITTDLKGKVVKADILPQQVIKPEMFEDAGSAAASQITQGNGVSVEMSDPGRAAGLLVPGSKVRVYLIPTKTDPELKQKIADLDTGKLRLKPALKMPVILESARVIRIGNSTDSTTPTAAPTRGTESDDVPRTIITLDLNDADAASLVSAQAFGDLYFAVKGTP